MIKKKVYYAHSVGSYDSVQETRDVALLESLGFEVINPNNPNTQIEFNDNKDKGYEEAFDLVFGKMVRDCDLIAIRAQYDGLIGAGVAKEIEYAEAAGKPVIELPTAIYKRVATPAQTKAYLKEIGNR